MATAFVVGDTFKNKVTELLEMTDSALPPRLRDELKETVDKTEPTTLSFSTARKLKQYLQERGKEQRHRVLSQSYKRTSKSWLVILRASFLPAWGPGGQLFASAWGCETSQSKWKY